MLMNWNFSLALHRNRVALFWLTSRRRLHGLLAADCWSIMGYTKLTTTRVPRRFAIKAFGHRAEIAGEYLHKGSRVYVEGRKRTESWEDKKTGGKNYRDLVYVDRIEFLDSRANGNGSSRAHPTNDEQSTVPEEDIPF
jgi:hypothetical protein